MFDAGAGGAGGGDQAAVIANLKAELATAQSELKDARRQVASLTADAEGYKKDLETLRTENFNYREQRRDLRTQLDAAQAKVPAEGTMVLSAEDAKLFASLQEIGKLDEISNRLKKATELERSAAVSRHAQLAGYHPSVLGQLLPADAQLVVKREQVDGKEMEVPYLTVEGKDVQLQSHMQTNFAAFMPALQQVNNPTANQRSWPPQANNRPPGSREVSEEERMAEKRKSTKEYTAL